MQMSMPVMPSLISTGPSKQFLSVHHVLSDSSRRYQALKRRHAFQKRGKITKKQVDDAEKAIEQKQTQIETAESQYKRMTEGPNKVALASTIRKMKNSESQLKARHERLDDEYKRGKR